MQWLEPGRYFDENPLQVRSKSRKRTITGLFSTSCNNWVYLTGGKRSHEQWSGRVKARGCRASSRPGVKEARPCGESALAAEGEPVSSVGVGVGRTHGGAATRAPPAGGKGVPSIVAAARPAVPALFARSLRAVPRHASVFVRARRERSLLHDRPAILAAAAGHHHSEDRLQRGGYHCRRLVHAARQRRYVFP